MPDSRVDTTRPSLLSDHPDSIRTKAKNAWTNLRGTGWALAEALAVIDQHKLWAGYGFKSMREFIAFEYEGRLDRNLTHWLKAGRMLLGADPATAAALVGVPVWNAIEAMPALEKPETRDGAMALLTSGASGAQLRKHVASVRTDLHQTTEHRSIATPSGTVAVDQAIQQQWARLMNVAAYFCEMPDPPLAKRIEWICTALLVDGYQHEIDEEALHMWRTYANADLCVEIEAGRICCLMWARGHRDEGCGGWNVCVLQYHHARPKSQGGHDGPVVPLCEMHHRRVTENADGKTWRQWAEEWGLPRDVWAETVEPFVAPAGEGEER